MGQIFRVDYRQPIKHIVIPLFGNNKYIWSYLQMLESIPTFPIHLSFDYCLRASLSSLWRSQNIIESFQNYLTYFAIAQDYKFKWLFYILLRSYSIKPLFQYFSVILLHSFLPLSLSENNYKEILSSFQISTFSFFFRVKHPVLPSSPF